jgi:hypothetical protein
VAKASKACCMAAIFSCSWLRRNLTGWFSKSS